jgi:hypothetical protein
LQLRYGGSQIIRGLEVNLCPAEIKSKVEGSAPFYILTKYPDLSRSQSFEYIGRALEIYRTYVKPAEPEIEGKFDRNNSTAIQTCKTDIDGKYSMDKIPTGSFCIAACGEVGKDQVVFWLVPVSVSEGTTTRIDLDTSNMSVLGKGSLSYVPSKSESTSTSASADSYDEKGNLTQPTMDETKGVNTSNVVSVETKTIERIKQKKPLQQNSATKKSALSSALPPQECQWQYFEQVTGPIAINVTSNSTNDKDYLERIQRKISARWLSNCANETSDYHIVVTGNLSLNGKVSELKVVECKGPGANPDGSSVKIALAAIRGVDDFESLPTGAHDPLPIRITFNFSGLK